MTENSDNSENSAKGVSMVCPTCRGTGTRRMPRAAIYRGQFGTAIVEETCPVCGGAGWLDDVHPPV